MLSKFDFARTRARIPCEYNKELLFTYRLIFGQRQRSHHIKKIYPCPVSSPDQESAYILPPVDPLLPLLCGVSCDSDCIREIYDGLGKSDPFSQYAVDQFPFFGKRLLNIQSYVKSQNPPGIMALWYDERNPNRWWTFWAVIIIGAPTLLFSFVTVSSLDSSNRSMLLYDQRE